MVQNVSASSLIQKQKQKIMAEKKRKAKHELDKYIFADILSQKLKDMQKGRF